MIRAIIVDDEPLARQIIREYLQDFPEITVVSECRNGRQAVKAINEGKPDLVFLDVRMPGMDGFEVLERLEHMPRLIFSTAYHDYAIKAFEVNAVDYLLKPYDRKRFSKAIRRILERHHSTAEERDRILKLLQQVHYPSSDYPNQIFVRAGKKIQSVPTTDIIWIEADGDYTKLHTATAVYLCNMSVHALEERLDPNRFTRVHRSAIVARSQVDHLTSDGEGGFIITLTNQQKVRVSRSYAGKIRELIW